MGITGLIPFLEKASKRGNISEFSGCTVAIDSYCWLHKGAFSCADKIAMGQPTDGHVKYCMKFVHMLLANKIKPILVFDGRHLPAKKETETKRRENRESTRRRAADLMRMGQTSEGLNLLRRSIDITHKIALQLIEKCHEENVDCIVAPYEADAQLAYLNIAGIADVIITEDSDLTLFGCKKIFFKMDLNGNGLLVEQNRIHLAMGVKADHFDIEKFRHMCILSGCDYLASLPGIGLNKACKFVLRNTDSDIHKALGRLGSYLNMKSVNVTDEYRDAFIRALVTFKHQLVYCPLRRRQVRLHSPPPEVTDDQLRYAGEEITEDVALQLALGNYDPFTMQKLHNFDPDNPQKRKAQTNSWHQKPGTRHTSIWSKDYKISGKKENEGDSNVTKWPDTAGKVLILNTATIKRKTTPTKRNFEELAGDLSKIEMLELYGQKKLPKNDETSEGRCTTPPLPAPMASDDDECTSPILSRRSNPFVKPSNSVPISPSLVCRGKRRIKLKSFVGFRPTVIDDQVVQSSKYFSTDTSVKESKDMEIIPIPCERVIVPESPDDDDDENVVVDNDEDEAKENRVANLHEESSCSSGIFSSETSNEQVCKAGTSYDCRANEIEIESKIRQSPRDDNNFIGLDRLSGSKGDDHYQNMSQVLPEDEEFASCTDNITSIRSNLFKFANNKGTANVSVKNVSPKPKIPVTAKAKTVRRPQTQRKPIEGQQSLLKMFGFQKKTVLKH